MNIQCQQYTFSSKANPKILFLVALPLLSAGNTDILMVSSAAESETQNWSCNTVVHSIISILPLVLVVGLSCS